MAGAGIPGPGIGIPGAPGIPGIGIPCIGIPGPPGIPGAAIAGIPIPGAGVPGPDIPGAAIAGGGPAMPGIPGPCIPGPGIPGLGAPPVAAISRACAPGMRRSLSHAAQCIVCFLLIGNSGIQNNVNFVVNLRITCSDALPH
jgi:hypothetical protein